MFLHSGASLHGHEYSDRPAPPAGQHTYKRSPLLRSAFATPKPRPASLDGARPSPPAEYRRPFSDFVPRLPEPVVRFLEPVEKTAPPSPMTEDSMSVVSAMSVSELSDAGSQHSDAPTVTPSETTSSKRRRSSRPSSRASRAKTTLALAYPAPRFGGKKRVVQKVAPKLFLQLQELSHNKRPRPVIDVFPSSRIAGPVIAPRLAKRFPRLFGPKGELGSADVVLMRSEDYDAASEDVDSDDEEGRLEQRQPIAVLSPVKRSGQTEIVLDDGAVWVARPLPNGSFNFVRTDEAGNTTTARWARRPTSKRSSFVSAAAAPDANSKAGRSSPDSADVRYTFSIINPDSRRHPVMATLTPQFLDIQDTYTSVSTSSGRYPPCRPLSRSATVTVAQQMANSTPKPALARSISSPAADANCEPHRVQAPELENERTTHPVDETTKLLISVTAVFLALESGWSPYFRPHTHHSTTADHPPSVATDPSIAPSTIADTPSRCRPSRLRRRDSSDEPESRKVSAVFSREQSPGGSFISPACAPPPWWEATPSTQLPPPGCVNSSRSTTPTRPAQPRRATSTGAAFMHRARIASAQQAESSDSEHHHQQPPKSGKSLRRPRLLSHNSQHSVVVAADRDRAAAATRHQSMPLPSVPIPSSPTLPEEEFQSQPQPMDKVVVSADLRHVVLPPTPTPAPSNPRNARKDRERKTQSAYYMPPPPMAATHEEDDGRGGAHLADTARTSVDSVAPQLKVLSPAVDAAAREKGFSGRMRSLGHWFRRLGHHSSHHARAQQAGH